MSDDFVPLYWGMVACMLFILEIVVSTGFFMGFAFAAVAMSLLLLLAPGLAWPWQAIAFGLLSVAASVAYFRYFHKLNVATTNPLLNRRAAQLRGKTFVLTEELRGEGAEMIGDTRWRLRCEGNIPVGRRVKVVGDDDMTLLVEEEAGAEASSDDKP